VCGDHPDSLLADFVGCRGESFACLARFASLDLYLGHQQSAGLLLEQPGGTSGPA